MRRAGLRESFALARGNRPFALLLVTYVLQSLAVSVMLAGAPYLATYRLDDYGWTSVLVVALVAPSILVVPLWARAAGRFGKAPCLLVATVGYAVVTASLLLTASAERVWLVVGQVVAGSPGVDVFVVADELRARGFYAQVQLSLGGVPANLHFSAHAIPPSTVDALLTALRDSVAARAAGPAAAADLSGVELSTMDEDGFTGLLASAGLGSMAAINATLDALPTADREQALRLFLSVPADSLRPCLRPAARERVRVDDTARSGPSPPWWRG